MQSRSIKLCTILFFLGNAVAIAGDYAFFERYLFETFSDPELDLDETTKAAMESTWMAAYALLYGLPLLLWFFITDKRSKIAKWILVALTTLTVVAYLLPTESFRMDEMTVYGLANLLQISAVAMLFRKDALKWFDRVEDIDPEVFN